MGTRHNNGWNLAKLTILAPGNVETVDAAGTYSIRSALNPTAEPTVLRIPRTRAVNGNVTSWYYLEVRETGGVFENVSDASTTGVSIRATAEFQSAETLLLDANPATSTFQDAPLGVGQTFDGGPLQISTLAAGGGSATVSVELDEEPPTAPSDLQASVDASGVQLSWVSTDNLGVERYFVFRDDTQVGNVKTPSFVDRRPPVGDHDYVVVAEDESLNQSDPSEPLTVTVPVVSGPTCSEGKCKLAYRYSGAPATWEVPPGVQGAFFTVEGANGGGGPAPARPGGGGARIWATLEPLTAGQVVDISVGGEGRRYSEGGAGGFNGGGDGGLGGGGGGYTKVELESTLEVLAAGGGGGGLGGIFGGAGGTAEDQGSPGGNGFQTNAQGATLRGGKGGAAGGTGGEGGAGGGVTGSSACPGGTQDGPTGASGESFIGGGGISNAGGGGGGGYVGGGQGGGGATDACGASAASGGGGSGSSYVAPGRLDGFDSVLGGDDGWLSVEYDNPIVALAHSYTTAPDQQLVVPAAPGVLSGASGPGGDPLSASEVTPPAHGSLTLNGDGSFTYTPASGYFGSDSFTYKAADPSSGNYATAQVTLAVAEPPTAAISAPADAAIYMQGQTVNASFACTEGPGGPGISSCTGTVANGEAIDTSATGEHTFTVVATSGDGLTSQASATYTVEAPAPGPVPVPAPEPEPGPTPYPPSPPDPPPSISIRSGFAPIVHRRVRLRLGCDAAAASICRGSLLLTIRRRIVRRHRNTSYKTIVLGRAGYTIPAGENRLISIRLRKAALTLLKRARRNPLRAKAILTVGGGRSARQTIILRLGRRWR